MAVAVEFAAGKPPRMATTDVTINRKMRSCGILSTLDVTYEGFRAGEEAGFQVRFTVAKSTQISLPDDRTIEISTRPQPDHCRIVRQFERSTPLEQVE